MEVEVFDSFEGAIRLFKRKVERDGTIRLVREKAFRGYEKPSEERRRKHHEALKRLKKNMNGRERG